MQAHRLVCLGALFGVTVPAVAQVFPTIPYQRTYDLLVSERTNEDILRLRDLNQDGDYADPGEAFVFFTNQTPSTPTLSGIELSSTTGVACGLDGTVYAVTSTSDVIVALRDLTGDGDADDAGEATIWFSSANNLSGVLLGSAQSLAVDSIGRVLVLTANGGSPAVGLDGILMVQDLNLDGDAEDAGEASYWLQIPNASGSVAHSNPTEFALAPDGSVVYGDIGANGPIAKGIYRAHDANFDGDANDFGELTLWWVPPFSGAAWYGMSFDPTGNLYVTNHSGTAPIGRTIYRAFDIDASGAIDTAEEQLYYTAGSGIWWDMVRRDDGTLLMIDSTPDDILALTDLNLDGDFLDLGEANYVFDTNTLGFPSADLRAMAFMRAPALEMLPTVVPIGNPVTFSITTAEPLDLAISMAALSLIPPVSIPPFGHLEIDLGSLILFDVGISNLACQYAFTLNLANDPALIGSYGTQAWCGELSRLFLSNPSPLVITP